MTREALLRRKQELQENSARLQQALAVMQGAVLEVDHWLKLCDEAEKGAVVRDTTAPLTPGMEPTADDSLDEGGSDRVHPAEAGLS